jgi:hypothetical protein
MHALIENQLSLEEIDSDADFILVSEEGGLLSEHYTVGEAKMALFKEASSFQLGERLPVIYRREDPHWVLLS